MVHRHLIYEGRSRERFGRGSGGRLLRFLHDCVEGLGVRVLIEPKVSYSEFDAWTGLVGIVTSHVSFHYWNEFGQLQFDAYSCAEFDVNRLVELLENFWRSEGSWLVLNRANLDSLRVSGQEALLHIGTSKDRAT